MLMIRTRILSFSYSLWRYCKYNLLSLKTKRKLDCPRWKIPSDHLNFLSLYLRELSASGITDLLRLEFLFSESQFRAILLLPKILSFLVSEINQIYHLWMKFRMFSLDNVCMTVLLQFQNLNFFSLQCSSKK